MGQAALDLPDPLETPTPAGAPAGGTADADELLSRMAGEEINRLLAEADLTPDQANGDGSRPATADAARPAASRPPPSEPADPPAIAPERRPATLVPAAGADVDPALNSELDTLLAEVIGEYAPPADPLPRAPDARLAPAAETPAAPAGPGPGAPDPLVSAELDQVFEQMTGGEPATSAAPAETPAPSAAPEDLAKVPGPVVARDAVREAAGDATPAPDDDKPDPDEAGDEPAAAGGRRAAYRRLPDRIFTPVLAPGARVPQSVLDAAGSIALLTILNSIVVLLYVFLIRRH